jgi:hypothetical protein
MDNHLQRCNIRFSNYVSNQGSNVSMRKVIKAIIDNETDADKLWRKVHGRIKNKHGADTITASLTGVLTDTDVEMLRQCIEELELLEKLQFQCIKLLEELANKNYAGKISLLCTILPYIFLFFYIMAQKYLIINNKQMYKRFGK